MRLFWAGFLMTGLLLIGLSTYDRRQAGDGVEDGIVATSAEDGSPMPNPYPTPQPKNQ
jgi:hypothetical protein